MKHTSKLLPILTLTLALAFAGTAASYAQEGPEQGPDRMHHKMHKGKERGGPFFGDMKRWKEKLSLKDEQVEKIKEINRKYQGQFKPYHEQIRGKMDQVHDLLLKDPIDLVKVRQLLQEAANARVDMRMLMIEHRLEIEKILTPEQKVRLKDEMEKMRGKPRPGGRMEGMDRDDE